MAKSYLNPYEFQELVSNSTFYSQFAAKASNSTAANDSVLPKTFRFILSFFAVFAALREIFLVINGIFHAKPQRTQSNRKENIPRHLS